MVEDIQVHTFDSRLAAMIEGSFAIYAAQLVQKGYKPDEIINELAGVGKEKRVDAKTRSLQTIYKNVHKDWSENNDFYESLLSYLNHRKQKNQTPTEEASRRMGMKLSRYPIEIAIQALDRSADNGWTGVFPESVKNNRQTQTVNSGSRKFGVKAKYRDPDKIVKKQEPHENI